METRIIKKVGIGIIENFEDTGLRNTYYLVQEKEKYYIAILNEDGDMEKIGDALPDNTTEEKAIQIFAHGIIEELTITEN